METQPKYKFGDWLQEENSNPFCVKIIKRSDLGYFYSDEAHKPFYQESMLNLIERPKRKVKKRFYMMAYRDSRGDWYPSFRLVDESFRDNQGYEMCAGFERKIMENSPYIELDCDAAEGE